MRALELAIFSLLGAAAVFSIIELGLSAYAVSVTNESIPYYDGFGDVGYAKVHTPGEISFLLFCSLWTLLVTVILIVVPMYFAHKFPNKKSLGFGTLALIVVTMIFWFAGFIAFASLFGGFVVYGYLSAMLAFAVMPWLVFLALTILTTLTAFGVLRTDRHSHQQLFGRSRMHGNSAPMTSVGEPAIEAPKV